MKVVERILSQVQDCIEKEYFKEFETEKIELKDLSSGEDWKELYKSICAFLNTTGGIVIIGINEKKDKSKYLFNGFNANNEAKLKEVPKQFTNDSGAQLDLSEYIRPDLFEIIDFMGGRVCVLHIEKLPEDKKYVMYAGKAYERKLTGDHAILKPNIDRQKELRVELELARELQIVPNTDLTHLDVDKLNDYIQRLNQGMRVETLKADIPSAASFLERKKFIIGGKPSLLGMLVCGQTLYDYVEGRCQVDCYLESPIDIASNKKVLKDNVIPLLENSIGFVFSNIATGISASQGGTVIFEYPERLIRETVNNALAHRDYSVNKFINITINPGRHIEVRNPGKFRNEQILRIDGDIPVRRIIPIPKAQNPRLADVLKTFDRWEGKGWGMSSLTNMALENEVDISYYMLYAEQDIGLFIPKGQVFDEEAEWWLKSFEGYILKQTNGRELSSEQQTVLAYFFKSERLNRNERYTIALTPDNNHFSVIAQLELWGLIYKHPKSPELYPVYLVNRTLVQFDFIEELRKTYGGAYDNLGIEYKDVLNVIFHFNEFGKNVPDINAARVGDFLFFRKYQKVADVKKYNEYKRKVRRIIESLTGRSYILKSSGGRPSYIINKAFSREQSLFD